MDRREVEIETGGSSYGAFCECCGNNRRTVWGFVLEQELYIAAYYINWITGRPDHGARIDLVIGPWGSEELRAARVAVSLIYGLNTTGPSLMLADAQSCAAAELAGSALSRAQVLGSPFAQEAYVLAECLMEQDPRLTELLGNCGCSQHARQLRVLSASNKLGQRRLLEWRLQLH